MSARFVDVAVSVPLRQAFTYAVPEGMRLVRGMRVVVALRARKLVGVVVAVHDAIPLGVEGVKPVLFRVDDAPIVSEPLLALLEEAAKYYLHPIGEVLRAALPPLSSEVNVRLRREGLLLHDEVVSSRTLVAKKVRMISRSDVPMTERLGPLQRKLLDHLEVSGRVRIDALRDVVANVAGVLRTLEDRGLVRIDVEIADADPFFTMRVERATPPTPTAEQGVAIEAILAALRGDVQRGFLIHGVTGSGKTEVYLRAIEETLARGKTALLLVPEIALTPQLVGRLRARLGDAIAVLHSGLKGRQRWDAWHALAAGKLRVAIGTRSALFAPLPDLGLIVVDEEHDPSFKQEEGFRYHARDMALLRGAREGATVVLGSATPSLESYELAKRGRITLCTLTERATGQTMPKVEIIDLKRHKNTPSRHPLLTGPMHRAIDECLARKEQAIIFLNRRGFAPSLRCEECGEQVECPSCSVALTEHRREGLLRCHYCDFRMPIVDICPSCDIGELARVGAGTERIEDALTSIFPGARVERLDRDRTTHERIEAVLDRMAKGEIDLLVGTQMVTKGHDLPGVTLVCVLSGDQSLGFPDFRASERTFQLLAQVAGRAGRAERPGVVLVQAYQPEHPAIVAASLHDYHRFVEQELRDRNELGYPPFARLVAIRADAETEALAKETMDMLARVAARQPQVESGLVEVLGPAPAPIARIASRHRLRLLLRSRDRKAVRAVALAILMRIEEGVAPARASVDVDPVSMF